MSDTTRDPIPEGGYGRIPGLGPRSPAFWQILSLADLCIADDRLSETMRGVLGEELAKCKRRLVLSKHFITSVAVRLEELADVDGGQHTDLEVQAASYDILGSEWRTEAELEAILQKVPNEVERIDTGRKAAELKAKLDALDAEDAKLLAAERAKEAPAERRRRIKEEKVSLQAHLSSVRTAQARIEKEAKK